MFSQICIVTVYEHAYHLKIYVCPVFFCKSLATTTNKQFSRLLYDAVLFNSLILSNILLKYNYLSSFCQKNTLGSYFRVRVNDTQNIQTIVLFLFTPYYSQQVRLVRTLLSLDHLQITELTGQTNVLPLEGSYKIYLGSV